jgi:hypothetical protein
MQHTEPALSIGRLAAAQRKGVIALMATIAFALLLAIVFARAPHRETPGALFVGDGFGYYMYLPSLVIDGDLDLTNQIAYHPQQFEHWTFAPVPRTGRLGNIFQVGPALVWLPIFLAAHGVVLAFRLFGVHLGNNGFGWVYELPVYCASFAFGLVGVWHIWLLLKELWGELVATVATALVVVASPVAAYLWFEPDMSHATSMTLVAMLFYRLQQIATGRRRDLAAWTWVGALCGLIALVRLPDLIVAVGVATVGFWALIDAGGKPQAGKPERITIIASGATAVLVAGVIFVPQMLVWKVLYGKALSMPPNPFYTHIDWTKPDLVNYLFSTYHGLFSWTPILLAATGGLVWGAIRGPSIMRWSLAIFCLAAYFNSSIFEWWAGASFGERRMVDYAVVFALGFGYLLHRWPAAISNVSFRISAVGLCVFNWVLIVRYFTHDLPEYGFVSWYDLYLKTLSFGFHVGTKLF